MFAILNGTQVIRSSFSRMSTRGMASVWAATPAVTVSAFHRRRVAVRTLKFFIPSPAKRQSTFIVDTDCSVFIPPHRWTSLSVGFAATIRDIVPAIYSARWT